MRDQTGKRNEGATSMEIALMDRTCLFRMEEIQCRMHESSNSQRLPYGALICVLGRSATNRRRWIARNKDPVSLHLPGHQWLRLLDIILYKVPTLASDDDETIRPISPSPTSASSQPS